MKGRAVPVIARRPVIHPSACNVEPLGCSELAGINRHDKCVIDNRRGIVGQLIGHGVGKGRANRAGIGADRFTIEEAFNRFEISQPSCRGKRSNGSLLLDQ